MRKDDTLWKGILESLFDDFLRFFFPNADKIFDIEKGGIFLDKELEQLFPGNGDMQSPKFVDKLAKVFTKAGDEEWVLIHIEIQGYDDKDFARRMFTYFYRILDKFSKPVTAIAIFTDSKINYRPALYEYEFMGTKATFQFNTYKIAECNEIELEKSKNPFASVILTALLAIRAKKLADHDLYSLKYTLLRNLFRKRFPKKKINDLLIFLQLYLPFVNPEYNAKFDKVIDTITENIETMGIREMVLERARKEGLEKGLEEGLEKGLEQGIEKGIEKGLEQGIERGREQGLEKGLEKGKTIAVRNLILKMGMSDDQAADIAEVSVDFVKKVRRKLKK